MPRAPTPSVWRTSLQVSLVVGVLLNLVNQGDALLVGDLGAVSWSRFALNFAVPWLVSLYSGVRSQRRA